ncbi:hypothetical protein C7S20_04425 [Christiangramia fulva]|uniref:Uncharacterized protein n=1 Tax=Christiangramia fulva TaxID=2126553 RepID=A0A2R3Z2U7_9FLAO|nr:hypothetical protein C7S20_04425 [Christiangramia fulva]
MLNLFQHLLIKYSRNRHFKWKSESKKFKIQKGNRSNNNQYERMILNFKFVLCILGNFSASAFYRF